MPNTKKKPKAKPLPRSKAFDSKTFDELKKLRAKSEYVVGPVSKILAADQASESRDKTMVHPSELSRSDWCDRRATMKILGHEPTNIREFTLQNLRIFDTGNHIHERYQIGLWRLGDLEGIFECLVCDWRGWDNAPQTCPQCDAMAFHGSTLMFLRYKEVPIHDESLFIKGHADALTKNRIVEIKSVGPGSVRYYAPRIYEKWERDGSANLGKLWDAVHTPFLPHRKQGYLYDACLADTEREVIVVYEWKPSGAAKEFVIKVDDRILDPLLKEARWVKRHVEAGTIPDRPEEATKPTAPICRECEYRDVCWKTDQPVSVSDRPSREAGVRRRRPARGRSSEAA